MRRRLDLVAAATEVFAEVGYTKAGISDITDRAGLGKGTFYQYFDSKSDIFDAVVDAALDQVTTLITGSTGWLDADSFQDLEGSARELTTGLFEIVDSNPHLVSTLLDGFQDDEIKQRLLSLSAVLEASVGAVLRHTADEGRIRGDLNYELVAQIMVGAAISAGVQMLRGELTTVDERQYYTDSVVALARALLFS